MTSQIATYRLLTGPFLLTYLLLPKLTLSPSSRVINVTSQAYEGHVLDLEDLQMERDYDGYRAYAASKTAVMMLSAHLAETMRSKLLLATFTFNLSWHIVYEIRIIYNFKALIKIKIFVSASSTFTS